MAFEEKYVTETLRKLRLKVRRKIFEYIDHSSGRKLSFDWDGAGVSNDGSITLIEVELGGVSDWHIQCHLCRLAVMIHKGSPVNKLVWIADRGSFPTLENCVNTWLTFFWPICNLTLPIMEYRTPTGELLGVKSLKEDCRRK
jgi:hypothetical protein